MTLQFQAMLFFSLDQNQLAEVVICTK